MKMLAAQNVFEPNFKEKIRCGEVYRYLHGNNMFQRFCYRCLECNADFESGSDFEEHVIVHLLQDDDDSNKATNEVIDLSSDDDENNDIDDAMLYAVEVTSMTDEVSECDLPMPIKQIIGQTSTIENANNSGSRESESDTEDDTEDNNLSEAFPCKGLRNQALHQYADPEKSCSQCPAYFSTKNELEAHRIIHSLPYRVECTHCYEAFASDHKLHKHLRTRRKKTPQNTQNGAKKMCNDVERRYSKSQSEVSMHTETDDDNKSSGSDKQHIGNKKKSVTDTNIKKNNISKDLNEEIHNNIKSQMDNNGCNHSTTTVTTKTLPTTKITKTVESLPVTTTDETANNNMDKS